MLRAERKILLQTKKYLSSDQVSLIRRAMKISSIFHEKTRMRGGSPIYSHVLSVTKLIADLRMDVYSLLASLFHDVLKNQDESVFLEKQIEISQFGEEVLSLLEEYLSLREMLNKVPWRKQSSQELHQLILTSVTDVRVLILRLAEKIDQSRHINNLSLEEKKRFADRIFFIYAPLAEYLGLGSFKRELEDTAFQIKNPHRARWLQGKLNQQEEAETVDRAIKFISRFLAERNLNYVKIFGRVKSLYSTWIKIQKKMAIGQVSYPDPKLILDRVGLTILVPSEGMCYAVFGLLQSEFSLISGTVKDYISSPKSNGYRSLQSSFLWQGKVIEIQIKTPKMHEFNEFGPASHLAYKVGESKSIQRLAQIWLKKLNAWKEKESEDCFDLTELQDKIYVISPRGDIFPLSKGATPVDYAYQVHSEVGNSCVGAKVNGKLEKLDFILKSGDTVEIITSGKRVKPSVDWLNFAVMPETREKIKRRLSLD